MVVRNGIEKIVLKCPARNRCQKSRFKRRVYSQLENIKLKYETMNTMHSG